MAVVVYIVLRRPVHHMVVVEMVVLVEVVEQWMVGPDRLVLVILHQQVRYKVMLVVLVCSMLPVQTHLVVAAAVLVQLVLPVVVVLVVMVEQVLLPI